ncbi:MAG: hypothetical protein JXB35_11200 [Anaerolineae bacterium]|nr:hypothetical protein [Anaerolineae bacterium]
MAKREVGHPAAGVLVGLFILSAATLTFEVNLTRLFAVAQFYHFAFMIISLALLGFGAGGTFLALFPRLSQRCASECAASTRVLAGLSLAFAVTGIASYGLTNWAPFDSFSIVWDRRQIVILALHYFALALPFLATGLIAGLLFSMFPESSGRLYAVNLTGSALGCLLAIAAPGVLEGEGALLLSCLLGSVAAGVFAWRVPWMRAAAGLLALLLGAALFRRPELLDLQISPYKGLRYALQVPEAHLKSQAWNSFSRVDVVASPAIRSLPGLSYRYTGPLPAQEGLFVDGDDLNAILVTGAGLSLTSPELGFAAYLPSALAYQLRPDGAVLVLEPRGGLEIWTALSGGAASVAAVESNALIVSAAGSVYDLPRVTTFIETPRSFVRRTASFASSPRFDVVTLALNTPYRPIRSGSYSLGEDYAHTVEAFQDYLATLSPGGLLVATRWIQQPPSESLRAFALAVTAVADAGGNPADQIVAFRGYTTLTLLVKNGAFTPEELTVVRAFASSRAFDLVYLPGLAASEVNLYNVLPEPFYFQAFTGLLQAEDRAAWYAGYPFQVFPPTDDRPFFGHFFRWRQAPQVLAELGKTWQPFGGAGYFVLAALLLVALGAAGVLILAPVAIHQRITLQQGAAPRVIGYFGLLGLGYLFVEVPLVQHFILFLGHPAYALTAVLFALLFFSGIGSAISPRIPLRWALALIPVVSVIYAGALPLVFAVFLGLPLVGRMALAVLALAPLGILMGIPFPGGLRFLFPASGAMQLPWAWGVNGAASVVASVLGALLALTLGFRWVLVMGAICYGLAGFVIPYGIGDGAGIPVPVPVNGTKLTPPRV